MATQKSPLAFRMRPVTLDEFVGQEHILGKGKLLRRIIESQQIPSLLFYGPPGSGKTTLGFIIQERLKAEFVYLNAAFSSVKEIKAVLADARKRLELEEKKTIVFIDEIHRFNKLQQEALVPDTEAGSVLFIGATIYNPRYYLINSLLSRSTIAYFKPLREEDIIRILNDAVNNKEKGLGKMPLTIEQEALSYIALSASGDARKALSALEIAALTTEPNTDGTIVVDVGVAENTIQKNVFYDKKGTYHYDTISAFIKSVRGSDSDSALYWLAKMLAASEDPRFIARRLVILASEDIGNANPFALVLATSCFQAVEFVGLPEAGLILAHTTLYCATSPKSNASTTALMRAQHDVEHEQTKEVPRHITTHAKEYKYPHNFQTTLDSVGGWTHQDYGTLKKYYEPLAVGEEARIKRFLEDLRKLQAH